MLDGLQADYRLENDAAQPEQYLLLPERIRSDRDQIRNYEVAMLNG